MTQQTQNDLDRHRAVARATGMLLWAWETPPRGRFRYRGHSLLRLLGHDPAAFPETIDAYTPLMVGDCRTRVTEAMQAMLDGSESAEVEYALRDAQGRTRWFVTGGARTVAEDGSLMLAGWTREITERKVTEVALADSREMLERAERMAGLGSWRYDVASGRVDWSHGIRRLLALTDAASPPTIASYLDRLRPAAAAELQRLIAACLGRGESYTLEHEVRRDDGTWHTVRAMGEAVRDADGRITMLAGTLLDVSALAQAEAARVTADARLQLTLAGSDDGIWDWEPASGTLVLSRRWFEIFDVDPSVVVTYEHWAATLHPADRDRVIATLQRHLAAPGPAEVIDYRVRRGDGTWRWVRDRYRAQRDAEGRVARVLGVVSDITVQHDVEEQLRMLGSAVENANDAVAVLEVDYDSEPLPFAVHRFSNPCLCRLLGRTREELLGERIRILFGPETDIAVMHRTQAALVHGRPITEEFAFRRPDGGVVRVDARIVPISEGEPRPRFWVVTLRDVTARREWEEALMRSEAQLRQAQRLAGFTVWRMDVRDGRVTVGEDFAAMYDLPVAPDGVLDTRALVARLHPEDRPVLRRNRDRLLATGEPQRDTYRIVRDDGSVRHLVSMGMLVRDARGLPEYVLGVSVDETERREREAALVALKEQAESAARAKSEFLANMSHELRTPLNGVLGMLELILGEPLADPIDRFARTAHASGEALLVLLNDILDLSKVEAGKLELDLRPFDLARVVREACDLLQQRAADRGLALRVELAPGLPPALRGDDGRLRQVILNLLGNAIKFTEHGEVVVRAAARAADDAPDRVWLRLEVADTGIGIPAAVRERLFQPFEQGDRSTTRRFGGTGLGLSICKQLVALMGGTIEVASVEGAGSVFTVLVPLPRSDEGDPAMPSVRETGAQGDRVPCLRERLQGHRLLLVDDNAMNRDVVLEMLRPLDVTIDVATNGAEAVAAVSRTRYDLVFLDNQMPVMDGFAAASAIRHLEATLPWPAPVLVAMTANAMRGDRERCLAAGMDDYVSKPVSRATLLEVLARQLCTERPAGEEPRPRVRPAAAAPSPAAVVAPEPPPLATELAQLVHAVSNAAQGEDADALRRRAAGLSALARRIGDDRLAASARALALAVQVVVEDWPDTLAIVRDVVHEARAAHDRLLARGGEVEAGFRAG